MRHVPNRIKGSKLRRTCSEGFWNLPFGIKYCIFLHCELACIVRDRGLLIASVPLDRFVTQHLSRMVQSSVTVSVIGLLLFGTISSILSKVGECVIRPF